MSLPRPPSRRICFLTLFRPSILGVLSISPARHSCPSVPSLLTHPGPFDPSLYGISSSSVLTPLPFWPTQLPTQIHSHSLSLYFWPAMLDQESHTAIPPGIHSISYHALNAPHQPLGLSRHAFPFPFPTAVWLFQASQKNVLPCLCLPPSP